MISEEGKRLLQKFYALEGESINDVVHRVAHGYGSRPVVAAFIEQAIHDGWFLPASPVISNAGTDRGYPISCFVNYVPDTRAGILDHYNETAWMSLLGGGVGGHWSDVRGVGSPIKGGGTSCGIMPFLKCEESAMGAFHQGSTRRGNYAAYLDVNHPEIMEFINMRLPHGDISRKLTGLHHGVNLTDAFMDAVASDGSWELVDPNSGKVTDTVSARKLFEKLVALRNRTGEPYLIQIDEVNRRLNPALKAAGYTVKGSNLCTEIFLPTGEDHSNVCCLSSVNLETYDDWEHTMLIEYAIEFLDDVLTTFIKQAEYRCLSKAAAQAKKERSIGLGTMGYHSLCQKKMIPMDSLASKLLNKRIFKNIKQRAVKASQWLAETRGEPDLLQGTGMRHAHLLAIAPNSNSSVIMDTSPSIEPWKAPAFTRRNRVGTTPIRNKYLDEWLRTNVANPEDVWEQIVAEGSIQNIAGIPPDVKEVFKAAAEIDQHWLVELADDRQQYLCQGQSLNLFFPREADASYVTSVHYKAMKKGSRVKSLYYLKTESVKADNVKQSVGDECLACEG